MNNVKSIGLNTEQSAPFAKGAAFGSTGPAVPNQSDIPKERSTAPLSSKRTAYEPKHYKEFAAPAPSLGSVKNSGKDET